MKSVFPSRQLSQATLAILVLLGAGLNAPLPAQDPNPAPPATEEKIQPPPAPTLLPDGSITGLDARVNTYHNIPSVRSKYDVSGKGLTVAVVDSGINRYHIDFQGRIALSKNFTGGDADNADDFYGHGSHVASIIAAAESSPHLGVAPDARIVALKVYRGGDPTEDASDGLRRALEWLVAHHEDYGISVVNLSLGDTSNRITDESVAQATICQHIRALRLRNVAVVVAAGNYYHLSSHRDQQGMAFPAICRETISVGAMYAVDRNGNGTTPLKGPFVDSSMTLHAVSGRCTPFTQRLSERLGNECRTDIFAAGFDVTGASKVIYNVATDSVDELASSYGDASDTGTSQSAPFISGLILLLQEHYRKFHNTTELPPVDLIEQALWKGGKPLTDVEDAVAKKMDNVVSSGGTFRSAQAERSFEVLTNPDEKVTTPFYTLSQTQQRKLAADLNRKAELISMVSDGVPAFPDFKPNVRFYISSDDQKSLAEQISTAAKERFNPLAIRKRVSPDDQTKIEVRYFRFPDDSAVAGAMATLIREQLKDADSSVDLKPTDVAAKYPLGIDDTPEKPGDIEVWFPSQTKQN